MPRPTDCYHLLIAEKDQSLMRSLTLMLQGENFKVTQATDCQEVWTFFQPGSANPGEKIDLVIIDASRSRPQSFRLINYLTKSSMKIPFVVLIEYGEETLLDLHGLETRAEYLCKPFEAEELIGCVTTLLEASTC